MLDVVTTGVLGSLHSDDIFILAGAALHQQPVDIVAALVFVALDKVPAQDKVLCDVKHTVTHQSHGHVVPGHAAVVSLANFVALPVFHTLEIHDSVIIEFLTWEDVVP